MKKIKVAIAGMGDRGFLYANLLKRFDKRVELVAVAEIDKNKLKKAKDLFLLEERNCFSSAEKLLKEDKLADLLIISTQDKDHVKQGILALDKSYDILLEKPISPLKEEYEMIQKKLEETKRKIVVCHVLRYTPIFRKVKELIDSKVIGEIVNINAIENVAWYHQAHSFVRGNWANSKKTSPMILAKCCHDMDLYLWLSKKQVKYVSSYGNLYLFKKENAPIGSGTYCDKDCKVQSTCPYDARMIYFKHRQFGYDTGNKSWPLNILCPIEVNRKNLDDALLNTDYGRCVYKCDNDVVDHQVISMEFEDGASMNFTMSAFTPDTSRYAKFLGTKGQIIVNMDIRDFEKSYIELSLFDDKISTHKIKMLELSDDFTGHGGGDIRMLEEFIDYLEGKGESIHMTSLERSLDSHYLALAAEESRLKSGKRIDFKKFKQLG